jgi:hypothetical protein
VQAAVLERDAGAGDKVPHGAGDEHFPCCAFAATRAPVCTAIAATLPSQAPRQPSGRRARPATTGNDGIDVLDGEFDLADTGASVRECRVGKRRGRSRGLFVVSRGGRQTAERSTRSGSRSER